MERNVRAPRLDFLHEASTASNLLDSLFDWQSALNYGKSNNAFDKVCHRRPLIRLQYLRVSGPLLDWLNLCEGAYDRSTLQFFDRHHCRSGVPQKSVLSPFLFLSYTLDLSTFLRDKNSNVCSQHTVSPTKMSEWMTLLDSQSTSVSAPYCKWGRDFPPNCEISGSILESCSKLKDLGVLLRTI
ncbi:hypothetical protein COOONC_07744 [Cooperia oncophora]